MLRGWRMGMQNKALTEYDALCSDYIASGRFHVRREGIERAPCRANLRPVLLRAVGRIDTIGAKLFRVAVWD